MNRKKSRVFMGMVFIISGFVLFYLASLGCIGNDVYSVTDPSEGSSPDFKELTVEVGSTDIIITIDFYTSADIGNAGDFVYLYAVNHHMVSFDEYNYQLRLDSDENGHFETLIDSGSVVQTESTQLQITISAGYIPDIEGKEVWGYSMTSTDRIPDSGYLLL